MRRRRRDTLEALWWLMVMLVGLPVGLLHLPGRPTLPRHLPSHEQWVQLIEQPLTQGTMMAGMVVIGWTLWAILLYAVVRDLLRWVATLTRRLPRMRLPGPLQSLSAAVLGAVAVSSTTTGVAHAAVHSRPAPTSTGPGPLLRLGADTGPATPVILVSAGTGVGTPAAAVRPVSLVVRVGDRHYTDTVRPGDTLWHLAGQWLGDPQRWPEIYQLNRGRYDQHGRMRHGDHIEPGWVLVMPQDAAPPGTAAPTPRPATTVPPQPASPRAAAPAPPPAVSKAPQVSPSATASSEHDNALPTPAAATHAITRPGVDLGDRGWITAEVATAIASAAALVWIQRRRRYRPGPLGRDRDNTDLIPLPRTIAAAHDAHINAEDDDMAPHALDRTAAAAVTPACLGIHTDNTTIGLPDLPATGVGLTGPGATAAARGVLATVLSAGGPWAPEAESTVITDTATLDALLPGVADIPVLDRLVTADTLDHALAQLEHHLLRRARLATTDAEVTSEPGDDQAKPMPPLGFLGAVPTGPHATRLAAILAVGAQLGITAVLLGTWAHGDTWNVHVKGTTTDNDDQAGPRLNTLDATAVIDILTTIAQARPGTDDLPPARPQPSNPPLDPRIALPGCKPTHPTNEPEFVRSSSAAPAPGATRSADTCRLHLAVLGQPGLKVVTPEGQTELRIRRTDGIQILVNLAVNPHGAISDQLMAALYPEVRPKYSRRRFHTTMHDLREQLDDTINGEAIPRAGPRYRLDPHHIDVDLWQLRAAIESAATALDPQTHAIALRTVIDLYPGPLAEGHSWLWLNPHREELRRYILDTYIGLADIAPDPKTALSHIQDAIRLDPYNEDVYQRAMNLHSKLGSLDGVRRTIRALSERLAELEIRVSPQTQQVASDLLARLDARLRASDNAA